MKRSRWHFNGVLVAGWGLLMFLVLPVFVVIPVSLTPNNFLSMPGLGELSLTQYANMLAPQWIDSIGQSVLVATGTTIVAGVIGTLAAIGLWLNTRGGSLLFGVMLMPIVVPPVVPALGMSTTWHEFGLFDSYAGTVIAHTTWAAPFVVITVRAALGNVDRDLIRAARNLGADPLRAIWDVVVPGAMPGILAGAIFAFITSWDELVLTLFVTSRHINTLPKQIFSAVRDNTDPTAAAVASILIAATLMAVAVRLNAILKRERKKQTQAMNN